MKNVNRHNGALPHSRFIARVALAMLSLCSYGVPAASQEPVNERRQAKLEGVLSTAQRCVVRIVVTEGGSGGHGSGVVVNLEEAAESGGRRSATILTAYHVLHMAEAFTVFDYDDRLIGGSHPDTTVCFVDRSRELALIRVELSPGAGRELESFSLDAIASTHPSSEDLVIKRTGFAFGYPEERSLKLFYSRIEFLSFANASFLNLARSIDFTSRPGEHVSPGWMNFQLLGDQPTIAGMSGGLVVDGDGDFAGLIYGMRATGFPIMMPASEVLTFRENSRKYPWVKLGESPFAGAILFRGGAGDEVEEDRLDLGSLDGLAVILGNDPLSEIQRFQEIEVIPRSHEPGDKLVIRVNPASVPRPGHSLSFWLDGRPLVWSASEPIELPLKDLRGESLLVVAKTSGNVNDFELGGLFVPSAIDLTFSQQGMPFLHLVRSLPTIVQRYPLFITIRNAGTATRPVERPANARLAVRLDFAEALLNQAPFGVRVQERDPKDPALPAKTDVQGVFRLDPHSGWRLQQISRQQIGMSATGTVELDRVLYEDIPLSLAPAPGEEGPAQFTLRGRLHFPYVMRYEDVGAAAEHGRPVLYVSARATGTMGSGSFRASLGERVSVDLSGVLRHLFTAYVNSQLTPIDAPNLVDGDKMREFLAAMGLSDPNGCKLDVRQAFITRTSTYEWLILTFRVEPAMPIQGCEEPASHEELLEPPVNPKGVVVDLTAFEAPGAMVANFSTLNVSNPVVAEGLAAASTKRLCLTLQVAEDRDSWFRGLAPPDRPLWLLGDDDQRTVARIQEAFLHAAERGTAQLTLSLPADAARTMLERALGAKLKLNPFAGGSLEIVATRKTDRSDVSLELQGGPFVARTVSDVAIAIGGGSSIKDVSLRVTNLSARGRIEEENVQAEVAAEFAIGELIAPSTIAKDVSGSIRLTIDTAPDRKEIGTAKATLVIPGRVASFPVNVTINDLPITISRDLSILFNADRLP